MPAFVQLQRGGISRLNAQQIQQCIDQCNQLANQLRSMGNANQNQKMRDTMLEGAHHIDLCVTECKFAAERTGQNPGMS